MMLDDQIQTFTTQLAIVNKIIKMIFLLVSGNCKYFFYGLEKELAIKKYTFANCLEYIDKFIQNTANLQIPDNLSHMLLKKSNINHNYSLSATLQKSNIRTTKSRNLATNNNQKRQRKLTQISSSNHTNSFKQFSSYLNIRDSVKNSKVNKSIKNQQNQNQISIRNKIFSQKQQRCSIKSTQSFLGKDKTDKTFSNNYLRNTRNTSEILGKENKISLQIIDQNQKFKAGIDTFKDDSQKELNKNKSNKNFNKQQRPSITVLPSFLNNLQQKCQNHQKQHKNKSHCDTNEKFQKQYSIKNQKIKHPSLINSKQQIKQTLKQTFGKINNKKNQNIFQQSLNYQVFRNNNNKVNEQNNKFKPFKKFQAGEKIKQANMNEKNRARSVSENIKQSPLNSLKLHNIKSPMLYSQHQNQPGALNLYQRITKKDLNTNININTNQSIRNDPQINNKIQNKSQNKNKIITANIYINNNNHHPNSYNKSADKVSSNNSTKKRSFLTKTNESQGDQNQKSTGLLSSRMDFSSISIQNRLNIHNVNNKNKQKAQNYPQTNKSNNYNYNYNNSPNYTNSNNYQPYNSLNLQLKRSLITSKYGFGQILQNPSCKQIQQQNQSRSYDGSSLKNTQNLNDIIQQQQKSPVFTLNSNLNQVLQALQIDNNKINNNNKRKDLINDSIDQIQIKQKNQQLLLKNQWKKTINNLDVDDNMILNQSIVDHNDQYMQIRQPIPQIKLQKLDKLTKNMYFSIVNKSQQNFVFPNLGMTSKCNSYEE